MCGRFGTLKSVWVEETPKFHGTFFDVSKSVSFGLKLVGQEVSSLERIPEKLFFCPGSGLMVGEM